MPFIYQNFQRWSAGFDLQNNNLWNYSDPNLPYSALSVAGFFNPVNKNPESPQININDSMWLEASDIAQYVIVTAITPNITIAAQGGSVIPPYLIQYVQVPQTAAQWKAMYDTPFLLIAAPGANKLIIVDNWTLTMDYVSAQYTAGGNVSLQYDSTVHGAGSFASQILARDTVNAWNQSAAIGQVGIVGNANLTDVTNKGLYISNVTADFATGDGTFKHNIAYRVVSV